MNYWLFQGNPNNFDVDKYLRRTKSIYWHVSRYQEIIEKNDIVFIWRAQGKVKAIPGIIGRGTISEPCKPMCEVNCRDNLFLPYQEEVAKGGSFQIKAGIDLDSVRLTPEDGMIKRDVFVGDPLLCKTSIITFQAGSTFRLSVECYERVEALWKSNGIARV